MNCIPINKNVDFGKKNQNIIHILKKCHVNCIPINKNVNLGNKKHFSFYDAAHWTVKFAKCNVKAKLSRSILRLPQKTSKLLFLRTIFQN